MRPILPLLLAALLLHAAEPTLLDVIRGGDNAALEAALRKGADPNIADDRGNTALHYAALYADVHAMALLLEYKANPNAANKAGAPPLMTAISDLAKVQLLIAKGAAVDIRTTGGVTPLQVAGFLEAGMPVVEVLLAHGAKPDIMAAYPAAVQGMGTLARRFLGLGITPNQVMVTAASGNRDPELLRLFLEKAPHFPAPAETPVRLPLVAAAYSGSMESVRMLLDRGEDVNAATAHGHTALMSAAGGEAPGTAIAKLLLDRGADPARKDKRGNTALDYARMRGDTALIRLLGGTPDKPMKAVKNPAAPRPVKLALEQALALLDTAGTAFSKANGCISCHNQSIPQMAAARAHAAGIAIDQTASKDQLNAVLSAWDREHDRMWQSFCLMGGGRVATLTYGLVGLGAANQPATPSLDASSHCLASAQNTDGSWAIRDTRRPLGDSPVKYTALGIRGLQIYTLPGRKQEYAERIARGRKFIENSQPRTTQDAAFQVIGLKWAGSDAALIRKAAARLMRLQRADGGWAQEPGMQSDAYATAQAVWALQEGAGISIKDAKWLRGAGYLRNTQAADGSWHVRTRGFGFQPYRETGFPHGHDQWISSAATGFAVMALAPLVEPQSTLAAHQR